MTEDLVVFAGSSAVEPTSPLPGLLAAELGIGAEQWTAAGIRGSRLARWSEPGRLPATVTMQRPHVIVILLTANDPRPSPEGVRAVDAALRVYCPRVIWLPPMPYPEGSVAHGRDVRMRRALAEAGVDWVSVPVRIGPAEWAPDRVHLTRAGYAHYARQVGRDLEGHSGAPRPMPSTAQPPTSGEQVIGELRTGRGLRLPLTGLDAVWLARAVVGEGGAATDATGVASTLVRRWALLRDRSARSPFRSLTDLVVGRFAGPNPYGGIADAGRGVAVRGYSQPVAVQWRDPEHARRAHMRELDWDAIEPWRREAVLRVLTGLRPLTARPAVHFASPALVAERLGEHPDWRRVHVDGARNAFVSTVASRSTAEPTVRAAGAPAGRPAADSGAVASVLTLGAVALGVGAAVWLGTRG